MAQFETLGDGVDQVWFTRVPVDIATTLYVRRLLDEHPYDSARMIRARTEDTDRDLTIDEVCTAMSVLGHHR
jgi:hypothetical protein